MSEPFDIELEDKPKKQTSTWIVVGALAIILVGLNVWPDETQPTTATPSAASPPGPQQSAAADTDSISLARRSINWPNLALEDIIRANPFQMNARLEQALQGWELQASAVAEPSSAATTMENRRQREIRKLDPSQFPVSLVFQGPAGTAAVIGDRIVYEGDRIEGMQIVKISEAGVSLKPVD